MGKRSSTELAFTVVLTSRAKPLAAVWPPGEARRVRRLCEKRLISAGGRRLTEDGEEIRRKYKISVNKANNGYSCPHNNDYQACTTSGCSQPVGSCCLHPPSISGLRGISWKPSGPPRCAPSVFSGWELVPCSSTSALPRPDIDARPEASRSLLSSGVMRVAFRAISCDAACPPEAP